MRLFNLAVIITLRSFLLVCLVIPTFALAQSIAANKNSSHTLESQEWVVVLDDPRPARLQGWVRNGYGKASGDYRSALELERFGKKLVNKYQMELRDQWFIPSLGVYCLVVRFNNDQDKTISQLKKNKAVQWVQPSNEFVLLSSPEQSLEDDPANKNFNAGLASKAPAMSTADGKGVVIAIIDSAVDDSHQDLAGRVDHVGDFVSAGERHSKGESHGTAIAGVMIGNRDTKLGVAGVAPAARLQAYRGCWESSDDDQTNCNTLSLARALDAVTNNKVDILNLSLSGPKDALLDRLLQRITQRGTIVVTSFDPARPSNNRFPSEQNGVLVVRASGLDDSFTTFFTAPGARVVATPGNRYDFMQGHSVAAAYTSGLLALRKQVLSSDKRARKNSNEWRNVSQSDAAEDLLSEILEKS